MYSSQWAADSAIRDYGADPSKVEVIPFGANLDEPPSAEQVLSREPSSTCRLLFVGKDWQRKGGDIAVQTLIALNQMGIDTELTTVGTVLPPEVKHEKLHSIAFLNKNVPAQRQQLNNLFLKSDFFIFPTRAECSPIVLCEAAAFGLPVIASDVGGISTLVEEGKSGYVLLASASPEDYANVIVEILSSAKNYRHLVEGSRDRYDSRLNWQKWAEDIHKLVLTLCESC
ncbi:glycosyltransferase family 4 protein [bacterium]|nr:glycosyltransferase family 4 protein [bacterium]